MNDETINIDEQLDILEETKEQIKQAIIEKGQEVSSSDSFRSYATKIGNIEVLNAQSKPVTPTTQQQIIEPDAPTYNGLSQVTVAGVTSAIDSNIQASNIKNGVTILGVQGTYTSDANATAENILSGKTAYVKGQKITGNVSQFSRAATEYRTNPATSVDANVYSGGKYFIKGNTDVLTCNRFALAGNTMGMLIEYSLLAQAIGLTADKIKKGEIILGITGTYGGQGMKQYDSEAPMNADINNISDGEVVKVVASGTTTYYIKDTNTMVKLVKETEVPVSPQEYQQDVGLADDILGNPIVDGND